MKNITILTICFLTLIFGCKKNLDESNIISDPYVPPVIGINYTPAVENIISSVLGIVVDEAGEPVQDAMVTLGTNTQMTDPFGTFRFEGVTMNQKGTFIEIEKQGYFKSGRRFFPHSAATNNVRIELVAKNFSQSIQSNSGGTVTFENGGEVIFSPNSIKTEDGNPYTGEVKIARKWLDPTAQSTLDQMPGALQGVNVDGEEMALETYGMIGVELEGANGEPLNIREGETAELKMPVPQELLNNAPTEIPLWSFNYEYGIWVEEGIAVLQNGFYVGEVSHFSFWNCDYPRKVISLSFTIVDVETLDPLSDVDAIITLGSNNTTGSSTSNADGLITGLVPADELLELKIIDKCGEILYTQNIGPFTVDTDLGTIQVTLPEKVVLSGELVDCSAGIVTNGLLFYKMANNHYVQSIDGPFQLTIPTCTSASSIEIYGVDLDNLQEGNEITFDLADSVNVGTLIACGQVLNNFIKITIDSTLTTIIPLLSQEQYINPPSTTLMFNSATQQAAITFNGITAGDYTNNLTADLFILDDIGVQLFMTGDEECIIDEYGENIGDVISGHIKGTMFTFSASGGFEVYVECEFTVIRDF